MTPDDPPVDGDDSESTGDDSEPTVSESESTGDESPTTETPAESADRPRSKGRSKSEDRSDAESTPEAAEGVDAGESSASGGGSPLDGGDGPTVKRDAADGDSPGGAGQGAGREDAPLGGLRDRVVDDADGERARSRSSNREGPLGDVAAEIDERRERPSPADDELFEEMDVGEVDSDALWEQVESEEPVEASPQSREIRQVDKHKYCQRCPHFAEPPTVECTHDGTEIVEQIDMETFEVADCPIILEDERLEKVTTD